MTRLRHWVVVGAVVAATGCATSQVRPAPVSSPPPTAGPAAAPAAPQAANLPTGTTWVDRSAEYVAIVLQTYRLATMRVESAVVGKVAGTWAVVLDADETVLNNVVYQVERERAGLGFTQASWTAWVRRREATPLPGAAAFLSRVRSLGGRIAIVTNRFGSECDDTAAVFNAHHLVYDAMLCRPDGSPSDKNPRFQQVAEGRIPSAAGPLELVAFIGDNILDFPSLSQAVRQQGEPAYASFGVTYFALPNPMYGSWQR